MKLSLIVPCYNEEDNVYNFYNAVKDTFNNCSFDYEIIFINDGSHDNTFKNLKKIYKESLLKIKIINFSRNFGKESAIYAGLVKSVGDYVSIIDADLQQNPKFVLDMIEFLDNNDDYDCVATFQEKRKEGKALIFFKNSFYKVINKLTDLDFVNGASDFRTFRRSMAESLISMSEYHRFSKGLFSWVGFNTHYMPYQASERSAGKSKWSFRKLCRYAVDGIVAFSTTPLRISSIIGIFTAILSVIYLIVVIIQKIFLSIAVPGYATIVVLILLLGGLQLSALGIIGEYLAKIYIQSKGRPIYIAKEIISYEDKKD
ncbi:MAG: glycosyltransferase [Clostridia bacterium]|nr:glycosyltransferase [Clostridia bacterium]